MLAMKFAVVGLFLTLGWMLVFRLARSGRRYAKSHDSFEQFQSHRNYAHRVFWLALTAVVATEEFVRLNGGVQNWRLFFVHLSFAFPFLVSLTLLRFWVTGVKDARKHKRLAYFCLSQFVGTLVTGIILIFLS